MRKHAISFKDAKARTKQSFKAECDINNILAKWKRTGVLEHLALGPPQYGDFENADDYQLQCNKIIEAQKAFDALPAAIRDRMHNDPGRFIAFMADPENEPEAREMGLLEPIVPAPPTAEELAAQGAAASGAGGEAPTPPSPAVPEGDAV